MIARKLIGTYEYLKRNSIIVGSNFLSFLEALWIIGYFAKNKLWKTEKIKGPSENILKRKPLKVAIVTEYYYPVLGGITEHVHNLALTLLKKGHDVRIITSYAGDYKRDIGALKGKVIHIGRSIPIYYNQSYARITVGTNLFHKMRETFEKEQFDIVHVQSPLTPVLPLLAISLSNSPIVATLHTQFNNSKWLRIWKQPLEKYILSRISTFISVSEIAIESLKKFLSANYNYVSIPNGINIEEFTPDGPINIPLLKDKNYINLLYVGRFDPRNGLSIVIEAFKLLSENYPKLRLLIVGYGPLMSYYESMIPNNIKDRVLFLGKIDKERPEIYRGSHIVCLPYKMACFSVTLIEALASGVPVIGTDIPAFRKIIIPGYNGFLADQNPESFANFIKVLLNNPLLYYKIKRNTRESVKEYGWDIITEKVLETYYNLGNNGEKIDSILTREENITSCQLNGNYLRY